jgi:putative ABC transport system permease protein
MFRFVAILMGVVTLFSVTNTVNMAVGERVTEIGTLRSIGLKRRDIRRLFVIEGALIGLLGAALGVALALLLAAYGINPGGLTWTPPGRSAPVPIGIDIDGGIAIGIGTVIVLTLLACVSSWWPARRAAKLEIVEALRHV